MAAVFNLCVAVFCISLPIIIDGRPVPDNDPVLIKQAKEAFVKYIAEKYGLTATVESNSQSDVEMAGDKAVVTFTAVCKLPDGTTTTCKVLDHVDSKDLHHTIVNADCDPKLVSPNAVPS